MADIAWDEASKTLYATVPADGGVYSNRLVAIDPFARMVTNSYPVGPELGEISLSPDGSYLYLARSNRNALQRFDLRLRQAGNWFSRGIDYYGFPNYITSFAVPAGFSDSVVVATADAAGNYTGVLRYDSGTPTSLGGFNGTRWVISSPATSVIYGWGLAPPIAPAGPMLRGTAYGSALAMNANLPGGLQVILRQDSLYDSGGTVAAADSLALRGRYPGVWDANNRMSIVEVDPDVRRVFFFTGTPGSGCPTYALKTYDRDLFVSFGQITVPLPGDPPARFLRWSTNSLVFNAGNQIWFVSSEFLQPTQPPADLLITQTATPVPAIVGSNCTFTLSLSNAGPGIASLVCVTNSLPANTTILGIAPSTGSVVITNSAFTWNVAALPAGSNATLEVTVRFGNAGWQTNLVYALGFESDPVWQNNVQQQPFYVQLPPEAPGVFPINFASEDLLYDPLRDRLLLSVGNGLGGQSNGLAVFDPYHGVVDSFTSLGDKRPARLARSSDGQSVYVSLPSDALVRRLTLATLAQDLEFALGGEYIYGVWYPFYAADLAVLPGKPESLAVWRVRRPGPMAGEYGWGIAVFDNGVMRSDVTAAGGNWRVESDADNGTLYGYDTYEYVSGLARDLYRFTLDSNGVSVAEKYPRLAYDVGTDVEYAGGRLFTTAGRALRTQPFGVSRMYSGSESGLLVEADMASGRVFYLSLSNTTASLRVHDIESQIQLGVVSVSNVIGTPTSLIRFGSNGLAFRTASNQVFLVRTPLVQPAAGADVALRISGSASAEVTNDTLITLTVTNQGPAQAASLQITNRFSPAVSIVSVSSDIGTWSTGADQVIWSLSSLDLAAQAVLSCTVRASSTGVVTLAASVLTSTPDPVRGNNQAVFAWQVGPETRIESVSRLQLAANDVAWSPSLGRLLITASNSTPNWAGALLSVDPFERAIRFESTLGDDAGRLAVSRDDAMLYVGTDYGLNALTLPGLAVTNRFLINPNDPRASVRELEVLPEANTSVLAGSRSVSASSTWLGVYDSGTQRTTAPQFGSSGFSLEFGDDPTLFYYQDHGISGFRRYAVQTNGVTLLDTDTALLPASTPITLAWADGQLFSSVGILVDPFSRTRVGAAAAITNNAAVCYDATARRAYFVSPAGTNGWLHAIDKATLVATGSRLITGVSGAPASLVRWGTNGLAFRTTGGQVFLLQTALIPSGQPADLALEMTTAQPTAVVGSNFVYSIAVANAGPDSAPNSQVLFRASTNAAVTTATVSAGTWATNGPQLVASLGSLAAGEIATVSITVKPTQPGSLFAVASATAGAPDPVAGNNTRTLTHPVALVLAPGATTIINQPASDLAYNPSDGRLYVSGGVGGIAVINPALALVETSWPMPSAASRLALSDNAQFLYATFEAGRRVGRINTGSGALELDFNLGTNGATPFALVDMAVVPGAPHSLAVHKKANTAATEILDDGVPRPGGLLSTWLNRVRFGDDPAVLYGDSLRRFVIGPTNFTEEGSAVAGIGSSEGFKFAQGCFYTTGGKRVEAASRVIIGAYEGLGTGTLVEPDTATGRVFFLTRVGTAWQVRAYDPATMAFLGSTTVTNVSGSPTNFLRWGADGLAFCTTGNQVFLTRSPLVPAGPAADLVLSQRATPAPHLVDSNVTFTLTLTNAGPNTASNVVLLNRFTTNAVVVSVTPSQGSVTQAAGLATCLLGTLTNGGSAEVQLTLRPRRAGHFNQLSVVTSSSHDPALADNSSALTLPVQFNLGPDSVGVVDLRTADLAYDAVSKLLYATPTNHPGDLAGSIVAMDPATGLMGTPVAVGPDLSQIAISDDGSRLYVLANKATEFRRLNLADGSTDLTVKAAVGEIKVLPGKPNSVVIALPNSGVVVYDDATPRPDSLIWYTQVEFFAPDLLLGFWTTTPTWTARLAVTTNGVSQASANATYLVDGAMTANGGLIYTSGGSVIDPMALTKIRSFGVSGPVAPDHRVNRVAFLTGSGSATRLRVFDTLGLLERGSLPVTNVQGTASKLLCCGDDRFAFRTSAGQVFILRSSAIPTGDAADLAMGLVNGMPTPTVQEPFALTIAVSNHGPATASEVVVSNAFPPSMAVVSFEASQGSVSGSAPAVLWRVGELAAGATATNRWVLLPQEGGAFAAQCLVWGNVADSNGANDVAGTTWLVHNPAPAPVLSTLSLSAADLAWEPGSQRLLMSVISPSPAVSNSLLRLDPFSGQFDSPIPMDVPPGKLAVSDSGQLAYVGHHASPGLAKVSLPAGQVLTDFSVGTVYQIALPPALPDIFVVLSGVNPGVNNPMDNMDAYRDGVELPAFRDFFWDWPTSMTRPTSTGRFYGYCATETPAPLFYRMTVTPDNLTLHDGTPGLLSGDGISIEHAAGLVFSSSGTVVQPEALIVVTNIPDISANALCKPDVSLGLLSFLTQKSGQWLLRQYAHSNYALQREFRIPRVAGAPRSLVRWGADGLAFLTTSNQLYLVRPPLAYADLAVAHLDWPAQVIAGQPFQVTTVVTNNGPAFAADAFVTHVPPALTKILSANASQGTLAITNNRVVFALGDVAAHLPVTLSVTLMPTNSADTILTHSVETISAFTDMQPTNNASVVSFAALADRDLDGLPDAWETTHGLNPTNALDATLDSDCDGLINLEEYLADQNPHLLEDLRLLSPRLNARSEFEATLQAPVGKRFTLEATTNFIHWQPVTDFWISAEREQVHIPISPVLHHSFFRLRGDTSAPRPVVSLLSIPLPSTNAPLLRVAAPPGHLYSLQTSSNLVHWTIVTSYFGLDCVTIVADPVANNVGPRYYRVLLP